MILRKILQNVIVVMTKEAQNVAMIIKMKYQINEKYIMKKIKKNFYRNKMKDI